MTDKKTELPCKFVLLGQAAVGKSSVVLRFVEGKFRDYNESTSGASYFNKVIKLKDNSQLSLSIWDTAGQERFKSLAPMDANAALVVFDLLDAETFKVAKQWVKDLKRDCTKNVIIAIVGNKSDLVEEGKQRQVPLSEVQQYAQENGLIYLDVSAKTGKNVDNVFHTLGEKVDQERRSKETDTQTQDPNFIVMTGNENPPPPKKGCCG